MRNLTFKHNDMISIRSEGELKTPACCTVIIVKARRLPNWTLTGCKYVEKEKSR
jgi:hypothetical protein